jgi:hypothetical protein
LEQAHPDETVKYCKWTTNVKEHGRMVKETHFLRISEAIDQLRGQLQRFIIHHQTKRHQADAYKTCKANATPKTPVMQID